MIYESTRPLNGHERELLTAIIHEYKKQSRFLGLNAVIPFLLVSAMAFVFMMWAGRYLAALFAIAIGGIVIYYTCRSENSGVSSNLRRCEDALEYDQAYDWHIQSNEAVILDIDSGQDIYAFQADEDRIVFISDQGSDDTDEEVFPSDDFSIVSILDIEGKGLVNGLVYNHGDKLEDIVKIRMDKTSNIRCPGHTEVIRGRLSDLQDLLRK